MSTEPEYRFELWAVTRPDDPYYYTNWGGKTPITVIALDQQAAFKRAKAVLGEARDHHWVFKVRSVTDHRIPQEAPDAR